MPSPPHSLFVTSNTIAANQSSLTACFTSRRPIAQHESSNFAETEISCAAFGRALGRIFHEATNKSKKLKINVRRQLFVYHLLLPAYLASDF